MIRRAGVGSLISGTVCLASARFLVGRSTRAREVAHRKVPEFKKRVAARQPVAQRIAHRPAAQTGFVSSRRHPRFLQKPRAASARCTARVTSATCAAFEGHVAQHSLGTLRQSASLVHASQSGGICAIEEGKAEALALAVALGVALVALAAALVAVLTEALALGSAGATASADGGVAFEHDASATSRRRADLGITPRAACC